MFDTIPGELKSLRQWIVWRLEQKDGRLTKVPYQINGSFASATDPRTWNSFDVAVRAVQTGKFTGIGFVFMKGSGFVGTDIDKVRDPQTGVTEPWAAAIIQELSSYTELSQSGQGWHVIVRGELPVDGGRKKRTEMYCAGRFFVMTGETFPGHTEIHARDLAGLYQRMIADQLDPRPADPVTVQRPGMVDESARDYALIGSLVRKLRTNDPLTIDAELRRRYPERYTLREDMKGRRGSRTYWLYSIEHFLQRRQAAMLQ